MSDISIVVWNRFILRASAYAAGNDITSVNITVTTLIKVVVVRTTSYMPDPLTIFVTNVV
ncbi:hypothetical protein [Haloquadratum walsbyi]|uniref:hypothetical protein n=1 Tax=Haloquadratum walsbyi TaxID=293091 RepID=UPI0023F27BC8|nr:hypothetical protein [Haloquadratum walsbyi]